VITPDEGKVVCAQRYTVPAEVRAVRRTVSRNRIVKGKDEAAVSESRSAPRPHPSPLQDEPDGRVPQEGLTRTRNSSASSGLTSFAAEVPRR
jgi:hypothetical protein